MNKWNVSQDESTRLDLFLSERSERSRTKIQKDIEEGRVTIDGTMCLVAKYLVEPGMEVEYTQPIKKSVQLTPENTPLTILYEDDYILVLNKPAGIIVHPNQEDQTGTLVQALLYHDPKIQLALYDPESEISHMRPGIVHRLDKDTSGVLVTAKTREALLGLAAQFQAHTVKKEYQTLVVGKRAEDEIIKNTLERKMAARNKMGVSKTGTGREAITHITPIALWKYKENFISHLTCAIETGRTHQIRVHCKFKGHPVIGDQVYFNKTSQNTAKSLGAARQLLHAARLSFNHPQTGERIEFSAPLPADFQAVLTKLGPADSLI